MVLIGKAGSVSMRLQVLASTRLMIVKGDPVSINAVGTGGFGNSNPICSPSLMSSTNRDTANLMQAPGLAGSNGFQVNSYETMLRHEVNWLDLPNLLNQEVSVASKMANSRSERVFILVEELVEKSFVSNHNELSGMRLSPFPTMDLENSELGL
jgi:hypothetical protein